MIRTMIVDDEWMVRSMLRMILHATDDITVVTEAADGAEAVDQAHRHKPDVALIDIRMPGTDGLTATRKLSGLPHPPKVVVLTTFDLDEYVHTALRHGAVGFLLKDASADDMTAAIRTVAAGDAMLSPRITRRLLASLAHDPATASTPAQVEAQRLIARLTDKERDVLRALGKGFANADIATELYLSEATIKTHISRILTKLESSNRVQAAIIAYRAGLTQ